MDAGDRTLFTESLRNATKRHTGAALDAALDEIGWPDALSEDPREAVSILFELQGAANVTSYALDHVVAAALGLKPETSVVLPRIGRQQPPGQIVGKRLLIHGIATTRVLQRASVVIVHGDAIANPGETYLSEVACTELELRRVTGMDPALGLLEVVAEVAIGSGSGSGSGKQAPAPWPTMIAAAQVALAHELVGTSRTMLRLAREHALERVQFGRPIAAFQAIRHRLADSLVAIEAAQAATEAAWVDGSPLAASLAKAVAGASARTVARHAQQVLGGMGYTADHALHRYLRRTLLLDELVGSSVSLTREIGEQLLRTRELPEMLPL
jgi:hypothetical protein